MVGGENAEIVPSAWMSREDAEEYTQALSQVVAGSWRQVALAQRLGVPEALGLTTRQWVERFGSYVKLKIPERRDAVKELTTPIERGGFGLSTRGAAEVLGVGKSTVDRDLAVPFGTAGLSRADAAAPEPVPNGTPEPTAPDRPTLASVANTTPEPMRPPTPGAAPLPEPGSARALAAPLLRFCPPEMTSAQIVTAILRVCFPDAVTVLDVTYGSGRFWDGSAMVEVEARDGDPARALHGVANFRDLPYGDDARDVALFDPPHLADGGQNSIMAEQFGTYPADELEAAIRDGCREAWRVARLGVVVKVCDHVHSQQFVAMSDWVKAVVPCPVYEVVHQTRERSVVDPSWREQLSAYSNGSTYLVFRKGDQRHIRRTVPRP